MTHKSMLLSLCLWLGMAAISPQTYAADGPLTIENVMSAPFPYGLIAAKIEPELLVTPNEVHDYILHRSWQRVFEATHEFIDRHIAQRSGS